MKRSKTRTTTATSTGPLGPAAPADDRGWLTPREAAGRAEVAESCVRNWHARYKLGHKVGGRLRIDQADLERFLRGEWRRDARPE